MGALQFQILADRIRTEYDVPVVFEPTSFYTARWINGLPQDTKEFADKNRMNVAEDHDGDLVFLARNDWHLNKTAEDFPKVRFIKTKEHILGKKE